MDRRNALGAHVSGQWLSVLAAVASLWAAGATESRAAEVKSAEEIAAEVGKTYGVEVLRVRLDPREDGPVYAVTVMNPPGNSNAAFQVNTLLVDAKTGALVSAFHHGPAGYAESGAATYTPRDDGNGPAMRRLTYR